MTINLPWTQLQNRTGSAAVIRNDRVVVIQGAIVAKRYDGKYNYLTIREQSGRETEVLRRTVSLVD